MKARFCLPLPTPDFFPSNSAGDRVLSPFWAVHHHSYSFVCWFSLARCLSVHTQTFTPEPSPLVSTAFRPFGVLGEQEASVPEHSTSLFSHVEKIIEA